ncbi:MAG: GspE/PulE family protein, partial [Vicinamibacteria bacterium]
MQDRSLIGQILLGSTPLSEEQLNEALGLQQQKGGRLGAILVSLKYLREEDIHKALSQKLGLAYLDTLPASEIDPSVVGSVPIHFAKHHCLIPIRRNGDRVVVAVADPLDYQPLDDLRMLLEGDLEIVLVSSKRILDVINEVYQNRTNTAADMMDDISNSDLDVLASELTQEPEDLLDSADDAPIIKLVNSLLAQAMKERASDIHIEPFEQDLSIRYRIDGILYEVIRPPKKLHAGITSRVKVMGGLNIAEKRLPQDGRIRIKLAGRDIDIRLSTVPTSFGERVVMRLLDRSQVFLDLTQLGYSLD